MDEIRTPMAGQPREAPWYRELLLKLLAGGPRSDNLVMPRETMAEVRAKSQRIEERPAPVFEEADLLGPLKEKAGQLGRAVTAQDATPDLRAFLGLAPLLPEARPIMRSDIPPAAAVSPEEANQVAMRAMIENRLGPGPGEATGALPPIDAQPAPDRLIQASPAPAPAPAPAALQGPAAAPPRDDRQAAIDAARARLSKLQALRGIGAGLGTAGTVVTRGDIMFGTEKGRTGRSPMGFLQGLDENIADTRGEIAAGQDEQADRRSFLDELQGRALLQEKGVEGQIRLQNNQAELDKAFAELTAQGVALKDLSPTELDKITNIEATYGKLEQLVEMVSAPGGAGAVGPFDSRFGAFLNTFGGDQQGAEIRRLTEDLFASYVKSISGAQVSEKEFIRLVKAIPTTRDVGSIFITKAKGAMEELRRVRSLTLQNFARSGRDVSAFPIDPFSEDDGIMMRGTDGRARKVPRGLVLEAIKLGAEIVETAE